MLEEKSTISGFPIYNMDCKTRALLVQGQKHFLKNVFEPFFVAHPWAIVRGPSALIENSKIEPLFQDCPLWYKDACPVNNIPQHKA